MKKRQRYLEKLIRKRENGQIKVITGVRRCGKSFLLFEIYKNYLLENGVESSQIIEVVLDNDEFTALRHPLKLGEHIRSLMTDSKKMYYILIDEIQFVKKIENPELAGDFITFYDVLNGLLRKKNADVYVTGSNSKMLSSDILTEFRGRGDEVRIWPLNFSEFYEAFEGEKKNAWKEFYTYGGLPFAVLQKNHEDKSEYLSGLFSKIYISDIIERNRILNDKSVLDDILNIVASSIGSLTNPLNIANTFSSVKKMNISEETVAKYLEYFTNSFLIQKSQRFDIKGKKYIGSPQKYYFVDSGLRNALLNFRQLEENHIMENIIFNELLIRGYSVDIGNVEYNHKDENGKNVRSQLEIDFVANKGSERLYIQSALTISDEAKLKQETNSLKRISDSFKKIIVTKDDIVPHQDENGINYIGVEEFLLGENND